MRANNIRCKLTIPFPVDRPDGNMVTYTKEALENAFKNMSDNLPVIFMEENGECEDLVIGHTLSGAPVATYDEETHTYNVEVEAVIYAGGTSCDATINDANVVSEFRISSIGITG